MIGLNTDPLPERKKKNTYWENWKTTINLFMEMD